MNIIGGVSLVASFFAGMVALFAPCCITFLLPSYLGNIFKNKDRAVGMTLVFGLGIATILVPVALGFRVIGEFFQQWHTPVYIFGGIFMILLGLVNLTGRKFTLPMISLTVDLTKRNDPWSVYVLGVFSGITSSCCTPVLAGVLTLSFLATNFVWAALAGFSYVFGMVMPLVVLSLVMEKVNWPRLVRLRTKTIKVFTKEVLLSEAIAGLIFIAMGVLFIFLSLSGQIVMEEDPVTVGETLTGTTLDLVRWLTGIPFGEWLFLITLGIIGVVLAKIARKENET